MVEKLNLKWPASGVFSYFWCCHRGCLSAIPLWKNVQLLLGYGASKFLSKSSFEISTQHFFAGSKLTYSQLTGLLLPTSTWSSDGLEIVEGPSGDLPIRAKPSLEFKRRHQENLVVVSDAEATGCQWWPQSSYIHWLRSKLWMWRVLFYVVFSLTPFILTPLFHMKQS